MSWDFEWPAYVDPDEVHRRPWWPREVPDRFLLWCDLAGLGITVLIWAAGYLAYVDDLCRREAGVLVADGVEPARQRIDSATWQCDFGGSTGTVSVVDHLPLAWTLLWLGLLVTGALAVIRHQRKLIW